MTRPASQSDLALASRRAAERLQGSYPALFEALPIRPSKIADRLGVAVRLAPGLADRAMLRTTSRDGDRKGTAYVKAGLKVDYARFALAHELGHFVLDGDLALARNLTASQVEAFCHRFAGELLFPRHFHKTINETLARLDEAESGLEPIFKATHRLGLSLAAFMNVVSNNMTEVFGGITSTVILVRWMPHPRPAQNRPVSAIGPAFRVVSRLFDPDRFYFPRYQRLESLSQPVDWLQTMRLGEVRSELVSSQYSLRVRDAGASDKAKFVRRRTVASLQVQRLAEVHGEMHPVFLGALRIPLESMR
jgi:hypothetical protein